MLQKKNQLFVRIAVIISLTIIGFLDQSAGIEIARAEKAFSPSVSLNSDPPSEIIKLIFIHHSTGQNWLDDGNGGLGIALGQNNYFVSDTNYGWGPSAIGDRTDIPNWLEWFRSDNTPTFMSALYTESEQHSSYTRTLANPGGENKIIMFKSCFPNSALSGNPNDPPTADGWLTVGHAKYVYNQLLGYFQAHPDKLFIVITAPPLIDSTYAANARAFNEWLMNNWLSDNNYTLPNVAVFDFYNVLTGPNNHHRYFNNQIEHVFSAGMNTEYYPSGDDHPSQTGNVKSTTEFLSLINIFYHRWADDSPPLDFNKTAPANNTAGASSSLTLSWGASLGSTSYEFCYDTTNNNTCNGTWASTGTLRTATLSGLTPNTAYYWQVRAVNTNGTVMANSGSWWKFTVDSLPGLFIKSSPANNSQVTRSCTVTAHGTVCPLATVTLKWSASANATAGYWYCVSTNSANQCNTSWIGTSATTITVSLPGNGPYYWQVRSGRSSLPGVYTYADVSATGTTPTPTPLHRTMSTPVWWRMNVVVAVKPG